MIEAGNESPFPSSAGQAPAAGSMSGAASRLHEAASDAAAQAARGAKSAQEAMEGGVHRMAQKAHDAVDRLEQTLGAGSERMLDWQQEYSDMAREQVRASPLAAVGIAFGLGILFSKLVMR